MLHHRGISRVKFGYCSENVIATMCLLKVYLENICKDAKYYDLFVIVYITVLRAAVKNYGFLILKFLFIFFFQFFFLFSIRKFEHHMNENCGTIQQYIFNYVIQKLIIFKC